MSGDPQAVLKYMETTEQIEGINEGRSFMWNGHHILSWFLKDKEFYQKAIEILKKWKLYDETAWSYSLYHEDEKTAWEFILKSDLFKDYWGTFFETKTFQMLPKYKDFAIFDYLPMVKWRIHKLGDDTIKALTNTNFRNTYDNFLISMTEKKKLTPFDWLIFISYLLIQDWIAEAKEMFSKIDPKPFEAQGDVLLKL